MSGVRLPDGGLYRYVPAITAEWGLDLDARRWRVVDGTLCVVDISGFTALSERLAARGRIGAEELTGLLSDVFASMIEAVHQRGGAHLKFGGDALLLLFTGEDHAAQTACAALEMRAALRQAAQRRTSVSRLHLRMSVGIESGPVHLFRVGASHRELIVAGPTATAAAVLGAAAEAGQIVVGERTRALLPASAAPRPANAGWMLRWRRSPSPPAGARARRPVSADTLLDCLPVALRGVLRDGPHEPEHRIATVAFLRYRGVDALLAARGVEATTDVIDQLITVVQEASDREGVTFLATDVDRDAIRVIVASGVPVSRTDDEGRMLRALSAIAHASVPLPVCIGVNRGHVFAGEVGGSERGRTYTIMGDTVNLAARLMAAAPEHRIYASRRVLDESHTAFATKALEPLAVRGKAAPVQAYDVMAELGPRDMAVQADVPFTGHAAELAHLADLVRSACRGVGGAVTVSGPAGIGKSRLVHEALARVPGPTRVTFGAEPFRSATPYRPLRDALRSVVGIDRADGAVMAQQLWSRIQALDPELIPWLPLVGDVTHIPVPATPEVDDLAPRFRPERTAEVVTRLLAAALVGPVAFVVEDAQWADEATAAVLERLASIGSPVAGSFNDRGLRPWLVIAVRRPDPGGYRPARGDEIVLEALPAGDARRFVEAAAAAAPLRPHDVERVVRRADGNPLYLEEIVRATRDVGTVDALPESLDAVVGAQIDALPPLARRLLRCAAVLGGSFRPAILDELLADEGVVPDDATRSELDAFLESAGSGRVRFRNALVREVAYEGLPYRHRRELHRRAAVATAREAGDTPELVADLLARHHAAAHDHAEAWRYGVIAADRARDAFANPEAAANYELALDAAGRLPDVTPAERADVLVHLGDVREWTGAFVEAFDAYRQASRLLRDDPLGRARVALRRARARERMGSYRLALRETTAGLTALTPTDGRGEDAAAAALRAQLVSFSAVVRQAQEKPREARMLAERAVEMARAAGDPSALARSYVVLDWAQWASGIPVPEPLGELALALYEEIGDVQGQAKVIGNLGAERYFEGRWDDAAQLYDRARGAFLRAGNAIEAAIAGGNTGELLVNQGRLDEAEPVLSDAARVLRASAFVDGAPFVDQQLGRLLAKRGDTAAAIDVLGAVYRELVELGKNVAAFDAALCLADAHLDAGDVASALELLDTAQGRAGSDAALLAPLAALVRGRALASLGRLDQAADLFARGVAAARAQGLAYELVLLLRAAAGLAQVRGLAPNAGELEEADRTSHLLGLRAPVPAASTAVNDGTGDRLSRRYLRSPG